MKVIVLFLHCRAKCKHNFHNLILVVGLLDTGVTTNSFFKFNEFKHLVVLFLLFQILFLFYYLLFVCIINFYFKMSTIFPVLLSSENLVEYPPQFVDIALVFLALIITMEKTEVRKIFFSPLNLP